MRVYPLILSFLILAAKAYGQPNCRAFLYMGDTLKYEACKVAEQTRGHYQFSREFQMVLDSALEIDTTFDFAYVQKSVAYLKSGDFLTWKRLMDKAVEIDPEANLGYRGWCRYQFFRDYKGSIEDIERLDDLITYDIGTSANGDYHLHIVRAICYRALGQLQKSVDIIESQLEDENYYQGVYDYLHLGVTYLQMGKYQKAQSAFEKQESANDKAENHYYLAMCYRALNNYTEYQSHLEQAKIMYLNGQIMSDPYTHPFDKVYLKDIEEELNNAR